MSYHSFRRGLDLAAKALGLAAYLFAAAANAAGTAHISVDSPSVIEGNGGPGSTTLNFTLTRSGETNSAVTLQYQTDDNSAVAPGDYTAIPSTSLTFAAGQTTANIPVLVNGDTLPESNESFFLHLTGVVDVLGPPASFAAPIDLFVGSSTSPISAIATDVNNDGRPDLAVANNNAGVTVWLNTTAPGATTATYGAASNFTAGTDPRSITITDVNNDGRPDLAVVNQTSNDVSVLLNTTAPGASSPSYAVASNFTVGTNPFSVTAADVNGDGRQDLAVANAGSNDVSVLLNTTVPGAIAPSYAAASNFVVGTGPSSVTATDANGDGRPDLAVANSNSNNVSVLLNTTAPGASTPSYIAAINFSVGGPAASNPSSITAVDVNGDGRPDLATDYEGGPTVSVLLNTTAPGASSASYAVASSFGVAASSSVTSADVNNDGRPDLVAALRGANVRVLLNTTAVGASTASYAAPTTFFVGNSLHSVIATDVNGDGRPDLAVADTGNQNVSVLLNTTTPAAASIGFASPRSFAASGQTGSVTAVDVNNDGRPDLITANSDNGSSGNNVSVLLNTTGPGASTPTYAAASNFTAGTLPISVIGVDVNADGRSDLAVANYSSGTVSVLLNITVPGATTPSNAVASNFTAGFGPHSVIAVDVNNDGRPDLAIANSNGNYVSVLLNTTVPGATIPGYATLSTFDTGSSTLPLTVAAIDINGDGRPDLVTTNFSSNNLSVLLNTTAPGASTASYAAASNLTAGAAPYWVTAADFNGDGRPDLAVANQAGNSVSVLLNTTALGATTPSFAAANNFAVDTQPESVTAADFNGDGRPDLVTGNRNNADVSVLLNTTAPGAAAASFTLASNFAADAGSISVTVADLNGDGRPDVATANAFRSNVSVLLNRAAIFDISEGTGTILDDDSAVSDTTPDAFTFVDQSGPAVNPGTTITSAAVTITGINAAAAISVSGVASSSYSINGGAFTSVAGTVTNGQTVQVRHTSSASFSTATDTILTVGGVSDTFTSTTAAQDTMPNTFTFVDQSGPAVNPGTTITSAAVTIGGINSPAAISVSGAASSEYSVGCTATFTSSAGTITSGQTVCVRHTSSASFSTATDTILTIGGVSDTFTSTTAAQDTMPTAFSFVDQSGVSVDLNTLITSAAVTIMGINDVAPISVTNGTYSIGCTGTFTSAPGTISNGQTVCVRHTSAATPGAATNTTLTVGGVSDIFTSITRALAGTTPTSPRGGAMGLWDALLGLLAVLTFGRRRRVAACATVTVHGFSGRIGTVAAVVAGACLATPAFAGSNAFYVSPQFNYTLSTNGGDDQAGLGGTATLGGPLASGLGWEVSVFSDHHSAGGPGLETDDAGIDASLLGFLGEGWLAPYVSGGLGLVKSKTDFNSETNPLLEAGAGLMLHPAGSPGVTFRAAVDVRRIFVGDSQVYQAQEDLVEVIVRVGLLIPFGKGG